MNDTPARWLQIERPVSLPGGTLVLAFSGWMDGGDVSTGTVTRLVHLLSAVPCAEIRSDPFYIYNFPGSMDVAAIFRPHIKIEDGLVEQCDMPRNVCYADESAKLLLFIGKEPNLHWESFGDCIFALLERTKVKRILFVGSFGGSVPHTRQPRLYVTCSDARLVTEMLPYGVRPSEYEGPGSFTTYLMTRAAEEHIEMISLVAEIPGYLQGVNPASIEAVTRRLAKILQLPLDLDSLRAASTEWELEVSQIVEQDEELATQVRQLEEAYDDDLLKWEGDEDDSIPPTP